VRCENAPIVSIVQTAFNLYFVGRSVIMKLVSLIIVSCLLLGGCQKAIEKKAEDAVIKAMTDGKWVITSFTINGTDFTSDFATYKFQYFSNYTVDAIKNGVVEKTGTWQGDAAAMNITSNFSNAINPLLLLNGVWHITDNSWTYVKATMIVGSETRTLQLEKV
jgi:hypothetical protein